MRREISWSRILVVVAGILVLCGLIISQGGSRTKDTPLIRRMSSLHRIASKLSGYADEHSAFPNGSLVSSNLDDLVTFGVLSLGEAAYIRTNQIEYRGFDLGRVAADVVVFDCVFSNTKSPRQVTAYTDGHVRVFQKPQ